MGTVLHLKNVVMFCPKIKIVRKLSEETADGSVAMVESCLFGTLSVQQQLYKRITAVLIIKQSFCYSISHGNYTTFACQCQFVDRSPPCLMSSKKNSFFLHQLAF